MFRLIIYIRSAINRWVENMVSPDDKKYWENLADDVDRYIHKKCPIDFKGIEECKYQQRVAEVRSKFYQTLNALVFFIFAIGINLLFSIFIQGVSWNIIIPVVLIIGTWLVYKLIINEWFNRCQEIILEVEKRIQYDSIKSKLPQEPATTPPQAQERIEPIAETKEREYPDIFKLYITIAVFFFTIYPVARDYVEKPSTFNAVLFLAVIWLLIFMVGAIAGMLLFKRLANLVEYIIPKYK